MTILIVDDDQGSRAVLMEALIAEGYEVGAADSGELALASLAVTVPELILLDVRMPGMDGFHVCRRLKEQAHTCGIPVIFLTADTEPYDRVKGLRLGAVDFITKPFEREELLVRVRTHLELARLRIRLQEQVADRTAELHESEERFRAMADAAPVMIWAADVNKRCTFFNSGWLHFTGRRIEQELGDGWAGNVHPEDLESCYSTYCSSFDARRAFQIEYRMRRADGEYRWLLDHGVPRFEPNGRFAGYVGSCIDITDLKRNHRRMLATQKLESLGLMAAGVAHDFGNLLGGMFAELDLALSDMPEGSPGRESVERTESLAKHAAQLVELLVASAGRGVESHALEPVDLSALVTRMLRLLKGCISKEVEVRLELATNLPVMKGNIAQIGQVVMNLITNATDALGGEPGSITVATDTAHLGPELTAAQHFGLPDGEYVRLKVSDTGCGMNAETRTRIFDQFFTTKAEGRGLGLAVVHGVIRSHGGGIHVVSEPGAGSTFEVLFPCVAQGAGIRAAAS
jgi:PAS domain S-box-containing protein